MRKLLLIMLLLTSRTLLSYAQTMVAECAYNVNGNQHSALIVLNGDRGKCKVLSNLGNCWFNASFTEYGSYSTITISNPSVNGWIGGVFYFLSGGENYVVFQNNRFPVYGNVIPRSNWNNKMTQYGFDTSYNVPFNGTKTGYTGPCKVKDP